ncbi:zinc ABC transporter substrate-binding protein ZnuA [Halopseudomonas pelagia]|uniref:zinc ABC transporter substrate-binding protein ZnuA n=1 Tax=Halopseudomonas pelagia TaxID=553151 RepID=UPI00039F532C|nr:zinc ABC transporter substrate-binding protein ZnuA [Halopseudomonas pelagia]|tara:strand:+ start:98 stop:1027 length:930 start_codon:yes stop_codon:yes gene_type:complete
MLLRSLLMLLCSLGLSFSALADSAKVLTTIKPLQQIAAAVMEGVDTPAVLLPPGNSPHNYALRPSDRRALLDAERIYWIGPELELFLKNVLERQGNAQALLHLPGMRVREQLQSINFLEDEGARSHSHDHGHKHDHGSLDAHIWLSPDNARHIARFIAEDLTSVYPQQADRLHTNAEAFAERLTALDARLKARLEPLQDRAYFVFHDGYGYFEDHYGLRPRGIFSLSHEVQPGARHINLLRQQLQKAGASCVFTEPQFTPRLVDSLTQGLPVELGELDPLGGAIDVSAQGYEQTLQSLAEHLAGCLEKL